MSSPVSPEFIFQTINAYQRTGALKGAIDSEDRVSPPIPAAFSFTMLGHTPGGNAYTFAELDKMLKNAGFSRSAPHALQVSPEMVIVSYA